MSTTDEPSNVIAFPHDYRERFGSWLRSQWRFGAGGRTRAKRFEDAYFAWRVRETDELLAALEPGPDRAVAQRFLDCIEAWERRQRRAALKR